MRANNLFTRNKKSVLVDPKKEEAREIIYKLAEKSGIFVEDYRPGAILTSSRLLRCAFEYNLV